MTTRFLRTWIVPAVWAMLPLLFGAVAAAQSVTYRFDSVPYPGGEVHGMNNLGLVIGVLYQTDGVHVGYVYDHPGVLGVQNKLYLLPDLIDVPNEWTGSSCLGINDHGQVAGALTKEVNGAQQVVGFVMDLTAAPPVWKFLPNPAGSTYAYGRRINANGDVLGYFRQGGGQFSYFYNVADDATQYDVLSDPATGAPVVAFELNNLGQVCGSTANGWFRLTPGVLLESIQNSNLGTLGAMNDFGVLCGSAAMPTGKKSNTPTGCFYDTQIEYVAGTFKAWGINNSNDLSIETFPLGRPHFYHANDGLVSIDPMLSPTTSNADMSFWTAAAVEGTRINERDGVTGYPQIAGRATRTTTTGSGKNKVTTYERRIFILTPQLAP